ncbi:hypothetical protein COEREDRAFT_89279 [Coemansia reversa NRRL 1564]|uniref:CSD domain-containing protein n=1 Tax=Coemansia reversa (strain ATCC 12441 / NRRL 1564) TaxID=763665 RepID=A0A2G5B432_COERN|nr:hypothetical protein COEREDRAFT_89279 [Coemansia reversa NRRL 1564]|eukprot:PIA13756.1 hypothetical protein COEREDRAFT_89279 [Coemansia reversa NRRL 1564]
MALVAFQQQQQNNKIFVHHTVIHNRGGFKSLAESEQVEFEYTRGAKGLSATRVTGPGGSYVHGDPYSRQRNRAMYASANAATPVNVAGPSVSMGNAIMPFPHYSLPSSYSNVMPYGSQIPQPQYAQFAYTASPPPASAVAVATTVGDDGFIVPANGTVRDSRSLMDSMPIPPQRYYSAMMPVPQKHEYQQYDLAAPPDSFDTDVRNMHPMTHGYEVTTAFAQPVPSRIPLYNQQQSSSAPILAVSNRQSTNSPHVSVSSYTKLSD